MLHVFEGDDDLAGEPCVEFLNPVDVDEDCSMDAQEVCGVEAVLEISDGLVDAVRSTVDCGIGRLVLRGEVRDGVEVEEGDAQKTITPRKAKMPLNSVRTCL